MSKTANRDERLREEGFPPQLSPGGNLQLASGGCAYMTRVEGKNTRLRHYERKVTSPDVVLFQVCRDAEILNSIATSLLKIPLDTQVSLIYT